MVEKDISMVEKNVSMVGKCQTFNSFVSGTLMITLDELTGSENYQSWVDSVDLWFIVNGVRIILLLQTQVSPKINVFNGEKLMLYYAVFFGNLLIPRLYIILGPIKLATFSGIRERNCTLMIFSDSTE